MNCELGQGELNKSDSCALCRNLTLLELPFIQLNFRSLHCGIIWDRSVVDHTDWRKLISVMKKKEKNR